MKLMSSLIRLFLLLAIFIAGVALIWHIGNSVSPAKHESVPRPEPIKSEPAPPPPPAAPAKMDVPKAEPVKTVLPDGTEPRIVATERGRFVATEPILFNSGLSTMREASYPKLNKIAEFLIKNPGIKIEIIGHTDNLGPEPVNQKVSAERAALVRDYLVTRGIDPSRLESKGMGSLDPIESNDTQLGRQANRRIEFLVKEGAAVGRP